MSLTDILNFRYPIVWVNTVESERFITALSSVVEDRDMYVFDSLNGLTVWVDEAKDFKLISVEKTRMDGTVVEVPITDFGEAFQYVYDQDSNATMVLRNFHKDTDNYLNVLAGLYNEYYRGFRFDNLSTCPFTVLCLAPNSDVPPELRSMVVLDEFELPTESAITGVLQYISEKVPQDDPIFEEDGLNNLAKACRGMTEFDVITTVFELVKESGKVLPEAIEKIKYERLKRMSSLEIIKPRWGLDEIGGLDYFKSIVRKAKWIRDNPDEAKRRGVKPINRTLLLGVPGCGKSYSCEGAASEMDVDLAKVGVSMAMNKFIGESEANMRSMFAQLNVLSPIAAWIDELGRDFQGGALSGDSGTTQRVHGELLTGLQNLNDDVALFAAANDISSLPPEMLRSGRFDKILFVGYPTEEERREIFSINLKDIEGDFNIEELAAKTFFFTGAEIVQLISDVGFERVMSPNPLNTADILAGIDRAKNRLWIRQRGYIQAMYRQAYDMHEWASTSQYNDAHIIIDGVVSSKAKTSSTFVIKG